MAISNLARFTINSTPSEDAYGKRGYDAVASEVLEITLEANPVIGVLTVTYDLYDSANLSSPLTSLYSSDLTFDENSARSYSTTITDTVVHITLPSSIDISSYIIRSTVVTATGAQVFERLLCVRKNGLRMTVPAETTQYAQRGWSDALNELTKAFTDGGVVVTLVSSSSTGTVSAFPSNQRRIFHSNGTTAGGVWTSLAYADVSTSFDTASINCSKIAPSSTDGYILRTMSGNVVWSEAGLMNKPLNPDQNGYVATGLNGDLTYILIGNTQVASNANIAVSKLAAGTDTYILKTVGSTVQWVVDTRPNMPVNPTDNGKVPIASAGNFTYGYISNTQVDSNANIAVTKLAAGSEGRVLKIVSGIVTWAVEGGGGTNLPATPGDDLKVAYANTGNLDYADYVTIVDSQRAVKARAFVLIPVSSPYIPSGTDKVIAYSSSSGNLLLINSSTEENILRSEQPWADGNVAISYSGKYVEAKLIDANISNTAAISVSKLNASGSNGNYLRISSGVAVWSAILNGFDIDESTINPEAMVPGTPYTVLATNASDVTWLQIVDDYIGTNANINPSKLTKSPSLRSVLTSNTSINSWSSTPEVDVCNAMLYLETNGYLYLHQAGTEPPDPISWACNLYSDIAVLKSKFNDNTVWEIAAQAWTVA